MCSEEGGTCAEPLARDVRYVVQGTLSLAGVDRWQLLRTTAMDAVGDALTTHVATVLSWTLPAGSVVVQVVDVTVVNGTVGVGLGRRRLPPGTLGPDSPVCLVRYCLLSAFGAGVVESMAAALSKWPEALAVRLLHAVTSSGVSTATAVVQVGEPPSVVPAKGSWLPRAPPPPWIAAPAHAGAVAAAVVFLGGVCLVATSLSIKRRSRAAMLLEIQHLPPLYRTPWSLETQAVSLDGANGGGNSVAQQGPREVVVAASGLTFPARKLWQLGRLNPRQFPGGAPHQLRSPLPLPSLRLSVSHPTQAASLPSSGSPVAAVPLPRSPTSPVRLSLQARRTRPYHLHRGIAPALPHTTSQTP